MVVVNLECSSHDLLNLQTFQVDRWHKKLNIQQSDELINANKPLGPDLWGGNKTVVPPT